MGMVKKALTAADLMATGLRNQWYAVCPSSFLGAGAMRRLTRLGEDWILFREPEGRLHMLEDRCPHRGAPLSQGAHLGDRIQCAYHGVQVNGAGTVVAVPGMPGCNLEGKQVVPSLPLREEAGAVLAYFGDDRHLTPRSLVIPDPLVDGENSQFLCYAEWSTPWRFAMENVLDPMHGAFLHRESHSMYAGDTAAQFRIRETDRGFRFEKTTQQGVNFDWVEYCRSGVDWLHLEIPYPPTAGPGGPFGIIGMITPITADQTAVFFWRYRRVQGWQRDVWRFLYKTKIEERHWNVLEQDRRMLEAMAPDADQAENLYQHDLGVVRIRRSLLKAAEQQVTDALAMP
jgi:phenylpropionate dioxygenase-like ring-hydroxylating dioxygenase large terminal subunit